jgi:acid phosphatase (class A)
MAALSASDLNLNLNLAMAPNVQPNSVGRVRFNSSDYRKLLDTSQPIVPLQVVYSGLRYPRYWDANLRSYIYLDEFHQQAVATWGAGPKWVTHLKTLSGADMPPYALGAPAFLAQVLGVLDRAADRDDRFAEIIDQNDADGAINYWLGMLMIDPARAPATYGMIRAAARVGEMVVMCLKDSWGCPRPSYFCPGIVPMIDPPATPSFPAGHAVQAQLISKVLEQLDNQRTTPRIPQHQLLFDLADRVGDNRVVAGIHFPIDIAAGKAVANECFPLLWNGSAFQNLVSAAVNE